MSVRTADARLQIKASDPARGMVAGLASVFGEVDSYGDVIEPGAFTATLREWKDRGRKVPMPWQHSYAQIVGVWEELRETAEGLFVRGTIADTPLGHEARELLKLGGVTGLSIGFRTRKSRTDATSGIRYVTDIDLVEISLVTWPAADAARISEVRRASLGGPRVEVYEALDRLHAAITTATTGMGAAMTGLERRLTGPETRAPRPAVQTRTVECMGHQWERPIVPPPDLVAAHTYRAMLAASRDSY